MRVVKMVGKAKRAHHFMYTKQSDPRRGPNTIQPPENDNTNSFLNSITLIKLI